MVAANWARQTLEKCLQGDTLQHVEAMFLSNPMSSTILAFNMALILILVLILAQTVSYPTYPETLTETYFQLVPVIY